MIKTGDFVAQIVPYSGDNIKKGLVLDSNSDYYTVQWLSYNKSFWLKEEHEVFEELAKEFLLTRAIYFHKNSKVDIIVLSEAV